MSLSQKRVGKLQIHQDDNFIALIAAFNIKVNKCTLKLNHQNLIENINTKSLLQTDLKQNKVEVFQQ